MKKDNLFLVLHSADSARTVKEFARITMQGFDMTNLVLSRVMGNAIKGIEEVSKECYQGGKNLIIVKDIGDFVDLVRPDIVYLFPPPKYATGFLDVASLVEKATRGDKIALVFGGGKVSGLTRKDLEKGEAVKVMDGDAGALGTAAIVLYEVHRAGGGGIGGGASGSAGVGGGSGGDLG